MMRKKRRTGPNIDAMEKVAPASESRGGDGGHEKVY
jgi:hypothetical protein